jgi:hypothetical protein
MAIYGGGVSGHQYGRKLKSSARMNLKIEQTWIKESVEPCSQLHLSSSSKSAIAQETNRKTAA